MIKVTMNSEQYENLIALMREALSFYANIDNYKTNTELFSKIGVDNGFQAKYTLKQVQETLEINQKMLIDYNEGLNENMDWTENSINVDNILNSMKNI